MPNEGLRQLGLFSRCFYCGKEAEYLCDHAYGAKASREDPKLFAPLSEGAEIYTCDRPLCAEHRVRAGVWFMCGRRSASDTTDYCLEHAENPSHTGRPMSSAVADEIRRRSDEALAARLRNWGRLDGGSRSGPRGRVLQISDGKEGGL